jgi:hypothetical protein
MVGDSEGSPETALDDGRRRRRAVARLSWGWPMVGEAER